MRTAAPAAERGASRRARASGGGPRALINADRRHYAQPDSSPDSVPKQTLSMLAARGSRGRACHAQNCCADIQTPCAAYWNAAAVFVGRVDAVARVGTTRTVKFTVLEGFRGVTASTIEVSTGPAGQRCSLSFTIGHEYVVFADRAAGANGAAAAGFTTSRCAGTRDLEDAGAELAYGRGVKQGTAPQGHISGRVLLEPRDLAGNPTGSVQPIPDVTVVVARDEARDTDGDRCRGRLSRRESRSRDVSSQRERARAVLLGRIQRRR